MTDASILGGLRSDLITSLLKNISSKSKITLWEPKNVSPPTSPNVLDGTTGSNANPVTVGHFHDIFYFYDVDTFKSDDTLGNSEMTRKWMRLGFIAQVHYSDSPDHLPIYIEKERDPTLERSETN